MPQEAGPDYNGYNNIVGIQAVRKPAPRLPCYSEARLYNGQYINASNTKCDVCISVARLYVNELAMQLHVFSRS